MHYELRGKGGARWLFSRRFCKICEEVWSYWSEEEEKDRPLSLLWLYLFFLSHLILLFYIFLSHLSLQLFLYLTFSFDWTWFFPNLLIIMKYLLWYPSFNTYVMISYGEYCRSLVGGQGDGMQMWNIHYEEILGVTLWSCCHFCPTLLNGYFICSVELPL